MRKKAGGNFSRISVKVNLKLWYHIPVECLLPEAEHKYLETCDSIPRSSHATILFILAIGVKPGHFNAAFLLMNANTKTMTKMILVKMIIICVNEGDDYVLMRGMIRRINLIVPGPSLSSHIFVYHCGYVSIE